MAQDWKFWSADLKEQQDHANLTDIGQGFWRQRSAKSKPDYPIAVWFEEDAPVIKVGNSVKRGADELLVFLSEATWLNSIAVTHADYKSAMDSGFWSDGKPARKMDEAERHGIDVSAGDNAAPVEETLAEQIATAVAKAEAITKISTEADAKAANELAEKLNVLFKLGDAERAKEKAPFDQGAKDVQARWLPIINPATEARERLVGKGGLVKRWLMEEQRKIDEAAAAERKRIIDEGEAARRANEQAAAEAADKGVPAPEPIAAPAPAPAAEPPRARAGSSFGRATGLRKTVRANITDISKLLQALATHKEMLEFAQTLANRAAKAGIPLDGMEIVETME